jgi:hypothetical protein
VHANYACEVAADHAEGAWAGQEIGLASLDSIRLSPNFALLSSLRQSRDLTVSLEFELKLAFVAAALGNHAERLIVSYLRHAFSD